MRYAKVKDGIIQNTSEDPQELTDVILGSGASMPGANVYPIYKRDPGPTTHPDADVPTQVQDGYTLDVQERAVYRRIQYRERNIDEYKKGLKEEVKKRRQQVEVDPIEYNGNKFQTNPNSQQKIMGAITRAKIYNANNTDTWSTQWKLADNSFVEVTKSDLEAVFALLADQLEAAYNRESEINAAIDAALTIDELNAIDLNIK